MNCLKNFIQIDSAVAPAYTYTVNSEVQQASGLFINKDISGITIKAIDKIANDEQETFLGVWDEVQNRALKKFTLRVRTGYREMYSDCCTVDDAFVCTNRSHLAMPLLYFLGSELMTAFIHSDRINRYTNIDKDRAFEIRSYCDSEFPKYLRTALEDINEGENQENGDVFSFVEGLP